MRMEKLKGFEKLEVFKLYNFLCIYETKISILKNSTEIYNHYPQLKCLEKYVNQFNINYANNEAMQVLGVFVPKGFLYCTNTKYSKIYNFLYHLRNSIAHAQIEKEKGQVYLIDYTLTKDSESGLKTKKFSGRGNLDCTEVFEIIEIINNVVKL